MPALIAPYIEQAKYHKSMIKFLILVVLAVVVGGTVFLATWDMPPPSAVTEKVIPNDRFK